MLCCKSLPAASETMYSPGITSFVELKGAVGKWPEKGLSSGITGTAEQQATTSAKANNALFIVSSCFLC